MFGIDGAADDGGFGLNEADGGFDFDGFVDGADGELEIDGEAVGGGEADAGLVNLLKTGGFGGEGVGADEEAGEDVVAGGVGFGGFFFAGVFVAHCDGGAGDGGVGWVADEAGDLACVELREQGEGKEENDGERAHENRPSLDLPKRFGGGIISL